MTNLYIEDYFEKYSTTTTSSGFYHTETMAVINLMHGTVVLVLIIIIPYRIW